MKLKTWIIAYVLFFVLLASCAPTLTPVPPTPTPTPLPGPSQVSILAPASGSILPLAPVNIEFEGASFSGITEFELRVEGVVEATVSPSGSGSCGLLQGTSVGVKVLLRPLAVTLFC